MPRRGLVTAVLMVGVLLCGTGATLALTGQFSSKQSAANKQYGPPPGCGHGKGKKNGCHKSCDKGSRKHSRHCRVNGTAGNDRIRGTRYPDTIKAGRGNDSIDARGGGRDTISCGPGNDTVYADRGDKVSRDCEHVHRTKSSKKGKKGRH